MLWDYAAAWKGKPGSGAHVRSNMLTKTFSGECKTVFRLECPTCSLNCINRVEGGVRLQSAIEKARIIWTFENILFNFASSSARSYSSPSIVEFLAWTTALDEKHTNNLFSAIIFPSRFYEPLVNTGWMSSSNWVRENVINNVKLLLKYYCNMQKLLFLPPSCLESPLRPPPKTSKQATPLRLSKS